MGANLQEWFFFVSDRSGTPGGSPSMVDDDNGHVYLCTVGTADSPVIYADANGTAITETAGVAQLDLVNGEVRFWTDRSITNLDVFWFGSETAGVLKNAPPTRHELPATPSGTAMVTAIPIQNTDAVAAETHLSITPVSSVMVTKVWSDVLSGVSGTVDIGIAASATGGDADGFLDGRTTTTKNCNASAVGVLSFHKFNGAQPLVYTPSAAGVSFGMLLYMQLHYGTRE